MNERGFGFIPPGEEPQPQQAEASSVDSPLVASPVAAPDNWKTRLRAGTSSILRNLWKAGSSDTAVPAEAAPKQDRPRPKGKLPAEYSQLAEPLRLLRRETEVKDRLLTHRSVRRRNLEGSKQNFDTYHYYIEDTVSDEMASKAAQMAERVWLKFRENDDSTEITVILVSSPTYHQRIRSCASMYSMPAIILECNQQQPEYVMAHETVHAIVGQEGGDPGARAVDLIEGMATRLAKEFTGPDDIVNTPAESSVYWLRQGLKTGNLSASSTRVLSAVRNFGHKLTPQESVQLLEEFTYTFGYFLIDALLKHPKYLQLQREYGARGKKIYSVLIEMNRRYAKLAEEEYTSGIFRSRSQQIEAVLKGLGFSDAEFTALLTSITDSVRTEAARIQAAGNP